MSDGCIKCRKCRKRLIEKLSVVCTAHGLAIDLTSTDRDSCNEQLWFVAENELNSIEWIKQQLDANSWIKGKLVCPYNCGARLGSYDFVHGSKCACNEHVLPSVHLVKSRVDFEPGSQQSQNRVEQCPLPLFAVGLIPNSPLVVETTPDSYVHSPHTNHRDTHSPQGAVSQTNKLKRHHESKSTVPNTKRVKYDTSSIHSNLDTNNCTISPNPDHLYELNNDSTNDSFSTVGTPFTQTKVNAPSSKVSHKSKNCSRPTVDEIDIRRSRRIKLRKSFDFESQVEKSVNYDLNNVECSESDSTSHSDLFKLAKILDFKTTKGELRVYLSKDEHERTRQRLLSYIREMQWKKCKQSRGLKVAYILPDVKSNYMLGIMQFGSKAMKEVSNSGPTEIRFVVLMGGFD
ncbi:hypothetical protein B4U79_05540, partial [Dinothrombium tinctorium]